jgi:hypothetical protein
VIIAVKQYFWGHYPVVAGEKYLVISNSRCGCPSNPADRRDEHCKICPTNGIEIHISDMQGGNTAATCGWSFTDKNGNEYVSAPPKQNNKED